METKHGLGCKLPVPDERDWPALPLFLLMEQGLGRPVPWEVPVVLDQGTKHHCVGYAWAGLVASLAEAKELRCGDTEMTKVHREDVRRVTNEFARSIYYTATGLDGHFGDESGATLKAGARAAQRLETEHRIDSYGYAVFDEAKEWCKRYGPVVVSTKWYLPEWENTDRQHFLRIPDDTSHWREGDFHAYLWRGTDIVVGGKKVNVIRNSWGKAWGNGGDAYITDDHMKELLYHRGQAMLAVKCVRLEPVKRAPDPPLYPRIDWTTLRVLKLTHPRRMDGEDVLLCQQRLNAYGADPHVRETNHYGLKTWLAVVAFQVDHGLRPNGEVGPDTWTRLLGGAAAVAD